MDSKKRRELEDLMDSALKHEDNLQHDENEEPTTYVNSKDIESLEHEDDLQDDENKDPVTFAEDWKSKLIFMPSKGSQMTSIFYDYFLLHHASP